MFFVTIEKMEIKSWRMFLKSGILISDFNFDLNFDFYFVFNF